MFGFGKKEHFGLQGQPLSINALPTSEVSVSRHLARIGRLSQALKKAAAQNDPERVNSLHEELTRRILMCKAVGVVVEED